MREDAQEQVLRLFERALEMPESGWPSLLAEAKLASPGVGDELKALLKAHAAAGEFLENSLVRPSDARLLEARATLLPAVDGSGRFCPGDILGGRFRVVRLIARGGMGEVYEVKDADLQGVHLALKVIKPQVAGDAHMRHRFEQEVLLARQITHPNLCPIYDIFHCKEPAPPFSFFTMKLLAGEPLSARLAAHTPLVREEALRIEAQMIAAIGAVHAAGIVHRDIKPNNVMVQGQGAAAEACLTDFGLARLFKTEATMWTQGLLAGTPGYMAPELMMGEPPSEASDVFALGVVLHQVWTGERPKPKKGSFSMVVHPRLREARVAPASAWLIGELLADDTQRRCRAFAEAQQAVAGARGASRVWSRRTFVTSAVAASIALVAASVAERTEVVPEGWAGLEDLLHPLPTKRFVALLPWPPEENGPLHSMVAGVVDAIEEQLSRVEALDHDFFIAAAPGAHARGGGDLLAEARDAVGANLVLTAAGEVHKDGVRVALAVMDPGTRQTLRRAEVRSVEGEETLLPQRAVRAAAKLLQVQQHLAPNRPEEPVTNSPEAYRAFQAAEALRKQENDAGLDAAIEKYKEALEADPKYAMAYARLAFAYGRVYETTHDDAALTLAQRNYEAALVIAPNLVEAHRSKAYGEWQNGHPEAAIGELARTIQLDKDNARLLLLQSRIFASVDRWRDAERAVEGVLTQRPNYWPAYNALGLLLCSEGRLKDALNAFQSASLGAPRSALPYNNVAMLQVALGDAGGGVTNATRSMKIKPTSLAAGTMATALRLQQKYEEALVFAKQAVSMDPEDGAAWVELGDCYRMLANRAKESVNAYAQGARVLEHQLATNATDGPSWVLLALCRAEAHVMDAAMALRKAETLPIDDLDSQLARARALQAMGRRQEARAALKRCLQRGATEFQVRLMPDLSVLQADPRYGQVDAQRGT
ncbi:serine/threonine-protein kinase [Acidipila sp. EB88]|uniref:serine/threonine-protein kinase n=1 Tax=Acidipila sp. EB88 TaxID=2305226 RepID=UPI001315A7AF|nr:serine/threonine-protein kinase [Acidipila sp. EB88]